MYDTDEAQAAFVEQARQVWRSGDLDDLYQCLADALDIIDEMLAQRREKGR